MKRSKDYTNLLNKLGAYVEKYPGLSRKEIAGGMGMMRDSYYPRPILGDAIRELINKGDLSERQGKIYHHTYEFPSLPADRPSEQEVNERGMIRYYVDPKELGRANLSAPMATSEDGTIVSHIGVRYYSVPQVQNKRRRSA